MSFDEKDKAFLIELTALSRKHGVVITGCGCCGSPSLDHFDCSDPEAGYGEGNHSEIEWLDHATYKWDELQNTIPRETV